MSIKTAFMAFLLAPTMLLMAACGTTNSVRDRLGLEGEYAQACPEEAAFEELSLCASKVYTGVLETVTETAAANPGPQTDDLLIRLEPVVDVATPVVDLNLQTTMSYMYYRDEIARYRAEGIPPPAELFDRAEAAYVEALTRWEEARAQIRLVQAAIQGDG